LISPWAAQNRLRVIERRKRFRTGDTLVIDAEPPPWASKDLKQAWETSYKGDGTNPPSVTG